MAEEIADYEPRTVHMVVRAKWDLNTDNPKEKVLFEKPGTVDLSRPDDFKDRAIGLVQGTRIYLRFTSRVTREQRDVVDGQFLNYLRISFSVWADLLGSLGDPEPDEGHSIAIAPGDSFEAESANFIHPDSRYAASSLTVGPMRNKYYIEFSLLFRVQP